MMPMAGLDRETTARNTPGGTGLCLVCLKRDPRQALT